MSEEWRSVVGYEGLYEVSSLGNVRSVERILTNTDGVVRRMNGKVLSLKPDNQGYIMIALSGKRLSVHRLVAVAFIPNPDDKPTVDHIDRNRLNNTVTNLRWATLSEQNKNRGTINHNRPISNAGHRFIYFNGGKYNVSIEDKHIGRYVTLEQAIAARDAALAAE